MPISVWEFYRMQMLFVLLSTAFFLLTTAVFASAPEAGGDTTVVDPSDDSAVIINEDAVQPESANIRLIVPNLVDPAGGTPSSIRILSVSGGTLWTSALGTITLGSAGTTLSLTDSAINLRFQPSAGWDTDASFQYVIVDPHDGSIHSEASTATITINAINDAPVLQTLSGNTGIGLAATYYLNEWDLTGATSQRIDATVNFSNNFGVTGLNVENFSARWTGQVKSPITGDVTFSTASDDGVRLWIDDVQIIDNWTLHGTTVDTASALSFVEDELYDIRLEFYERGGGEVIQLRWAYSGQSTQIIPQAYLFPATTRPALNYVNGAVSTIIDDAITVSDVDSAMIASGAVVISSNYESDEDSLLFTNQNGISGSYSAGTLRLTGSASLAHYQTALRSVRYANSEESPTDDTRTITFTVTDTSNGESNDTYRNIEFTGENTPPVITEGASTSVTMDENGSPTAFSLTLNATDADFHSVEWSIASAASNGTASVSGNGDSKDITYVPDADYAGSDSFVVQISDGNGGTDTITVNVTITERTPPVITSVAAEASGTGAAIVTWTTNEVASTKVQYGLASSNMSTTSETDTSPRVTSHSRTITGLLSCTTYRYAVISRDAALNTATGSVKTFTTGGCVGASEVTTSTGTNVIANGNGSTGSIVLPGAVSIEVPSGYVASNATCPTGAQFQLKALSAAPVKAELGSPSGKNTIVNALDLSAYCPDATRVTSFDEPLTLTFSYTDNDIAGLDESSLGVYRWGSESTSWEQLSCTINATTNTMTCNTTDFSSFGMFGTPISSSATESGDSSGGGGRGGCRGRNCRTTLQTNPLAYRAFDDDSVHAAAGSPPACVADSLPQENRHLSMFIAGQPLRFEDVPVSEWYSCGIHAVIDRGIFSGYRDGRGRLTGLYGPGDHITLGQLAKVAMQLSGVPVAEKPGNAWAEPYMQAAQTANFSAFQMKLSAHTPATRGAVIETILEALDIPMEAGALPYADVPEGSLYANAVATATALGVVSGDDETGLLRPNASINRAEAAKIIALALEYRERQVAQ